MPSLVATLLRAGLIASLASAATLPTSLLSGLSRCRYRILISCWLAASGRELRAGSCRRCDVAVGDRGAFLASHRASCRLAVVA